MIINPNKQKRNLKRIVIIINKLKIFKLKKLSNLV